MHHDISSTLLTLAVYLAALIAGVLILRRLGLGSAIAYLLVGAITGPAALGIVGQNETVAVLAEFGVVLLLFAIGLELRPARLWRLRIDIGVLGSAQLFITGAVIAALLKWGLDWSWGASLVAGAGLALSSTAFGVQNLEDRNLIGSRFADRVISILLFQDLAVVPLFALVSLSSETGLSDHGVGGGPFIALATAFAAIVILILVGRYGIGPFFRLIARSEAKEGFTAGALLVVTCASMLTLQAGLSAAAGAVVAGVMLAESEYRDRIEGAIDPFRSLFMGLFFIGIGINVDWLAVANSIHIALLGTVALLLVKGTILFVLASIRGSSERNALRTAAMLSQAGEFAFVLFGLSIDSGILSKEAASILTAITALSMAMTPIALRLLERWFEHQDRKSPQHGVVAGTADEHEIGEPAMVVVGYGRYGQAVAEILQRRGYELTLVDKSPERIRIARARGYKVYFGDLTHHEVLHSLERHGVRAIFVCTEESEASRKAIARLRSRFPDCLLLARVRDRLAQWNTIQVGADRAVPEVFDSALAMAREGLTMLGEGGAAEEAIAEYRRDDAVKIERMLTTYRSEKVETEEETDSDDDAVTDSGDGKSLL